MLDCFQNTCCRLGTQFWKMQTMLLIPYVDNYAIWILILMCQMCLLLCFPILEQLREYCLYWKNRYDNTSLAQNLLIFLICHEDSVFLYPSWKITFQLVCSTQGVVFLQILSFALYVFYHNLFSPKIINYHFLCIVPCVIVSCKELNLMSFTTFGSNILA